MTEHVTAETPIVWGREIATESVRGIDYRMYTQRPRTLPQVFRESRR